MLPKSLLSKRVVLGDSLFLDLELDLEEYNKFSSDPLLILNDILFW